MRYIRLFRWGAFSRPSVAQIYARGEFLTDGTQIPLRSLSAGFTPNGADSAHRATSPGELLHSTSHGSMRILWKLIYFAYVSWQLVCIRAFLAVILFSYAHSLLLFFSLCTLFLCPESLFLVVFPAAFSLAEILFIFKHLCLLRFIHALKQNPEMPFTCSCMLYPACICDFSKHPNAGQIPVLATVF